MFKSPICVTNIRNHNAGIQAW